MPSAHATSDAALLRRSISGLSRRLRAQDAPEGVGPTGLTILGRLTRMGVASANEIARAEQLQPQSLSRALKTLADEGLIDRWTDEDDRRRTSLAITPKGEAYLGDTIRRRVHWLADVMESRLDPAERETLRTAALLMERMTGGSNRASAADLVFNLIPSARVADVQRSVAFYERLGFVVDGRWEDGGTLVWASMHAKLVRAARIMFSGGDDHGAPPEPHAQGIHYYCWTDNIAALHARLTSEGCAPSAIAHPEHMPDGEFSLTDPDGYCVLVGQVTRRA